VAEGLESFNITDILKPLSAALFTVAEKFAYIITSDIMQDRLGFLLLGFILNLMFHL
jgi:hypothetical protein